MAWARAEALARQEQNKKKPETIESVMTEPIDVVLTKLGVLEVLNRYATHAAKS